MKCVWADQTTMVRKVGMGSLQEFLQRRVIVVHMAKQLMAEES